MNGLQYAFEEALGFTHDYYDVLAYRLTPGFWDNFQLNTQYPNYLKVICKEEGLEKAVKIVREVLGILSRPEIRTKVDSEAASHFQKEMRYLRSRYIELLSKSNIKCVTSNNPMKTIGVEAFRNLEGECWATLNVMPMPGQVIRILRICDNINIRKSMIRHEISYQEVVPVLFAALENPTSFSRQYPQLKLLLQKAALLFKHAAFVCYFPNFRMLSWVDLLIEWAKITGNKDQVVAIVKELKLFHLVPDIIKDEVFVYYGNKQNISFQDYVKLMTFHALNEYSLPEELKQALVEEFGECDLLRRDLLFFITALNGLFFPREGEPRPTIKESIDSAMPLSDSLSPFTRARRLWKNLVEANLKVKFEESDDATTKSAMEGMIKTIEGFRSTHTAHVMRAFLWMQFLENMSLYEIDQQKSNQLFRWFYELSQQNSQPSFMNDFLTFAEKSKVKARSYVLASDFAVADAKQLFLLYMWELFIRTYLPPKIYERLFDAIAPLPEVDQNKVLLCLHKILFLYKGSNDFTHDIEPFFARLDVDLKENKKFEDTGTRSRGIYFFNDNLKIIEELKNQSAVYECLHVLLVFFEIESYTHLKQNLQVELARRIAKVSVDERMLCIKELQRLSIVSLLKNHYGDDGVIQNPINHQLQEIQMSTIVAFEYGLQTTVPLGTLVLTFVFCPYASNQYILDGVRKLIQLRRDVYSDASEGMRFEHPSKSEEIKESIDLLKGQRYKKLDSYLNRHLTLLERQLLSTVSPSLIGISDQIHRQCKTLFTEHKIDLENQQSDLLLPYPHIVSDSKLHIEAPWKTSAYTTTWKVGENGCPALELILFRYNADGGINSRNIHIALDIPVDELNEPVWALFDIYLEALARDRIVVNSTKYFDNFEKTDLGTEFDIFQSKIEGPFRNRVHKFIIEYAKQTKEKVVSYSGFMSIQSDDGSNHEIPNAIFDAFTKCRKMIFDFIMNLKHELRLNQLSFFSEGQKRSGKNNFYDQRSHASEGRIYSSPRGLSIIPLHVLHPMNDEQSKYYLVKTQDIDFSAFLKFIDPSGMSFEIDVCKIILNDKFGSEIEGHFVASFDPTAKQNRITFKLIVEGFKPITYAVDYKAFIQNPHFEKMLYWQVAMLKSLYYHQLMQSIYSVASKH